MKHITKNTVANIAKGYAIVNGISGIIIGFYIWSEESGFIGFGDL